MIRFLRAIGSPQTKFHSEIVSDYVKDIPNKRWYRQDGRVLTVGNELAIQNLPGQTKHRTQDRFGMAVSLSMIKTFDSLILHKFHP